MLAGEPPTTRLPGILLVRRRFINKNRDPTTVLFLWKAQLLPESFASFARIGARIGSAMAGRPIVFISSTLEDLKEYREQAGKAAEASGFAPSRMEYWSAADGRRCRNVSRKWTGRKPLWSLWPTTMDGCPTIPPTPMRRASHGLSANTPGSPTNRCSRSWWTRNTIGRRNIGNQTSQFFANVYVDPLDHFVIRELRPGFYLRYVDDFVLFGNDKKELGLMAERIRQFLQGLRLSPPRTKFRVYRCDEGLTLLGWRLLPGQARLARPNVVRMRRRLTKMAASYHAGRLSFQQVQCGVQAWPGDAAFGDTWRLRLRLFARFHPKSGSCQCLAAALRRIDHRFLWSVRLRSSQLQSEQSSPGR